MHIETAAVTDIPQLNELLTILFTQEAEFRSDHVAQRRGLELILADPGLGSILVARREGRVVGMVNLLYTVSTALGARVALLEDMVVLPGERNGGAGSRLLQAAIAHARTAGCRRITLLTDADNLAARRFYQRHGFADSPMVPLRLVLDAD